jgi:hypothetical protein
MVFARPILHPTDENAAGAREVKVQPNSKAGMENNTRRYVLYSARLGQ